MITADSDVLIDFLGKRQPATQIVAALLARGRLRTTVITRFELLSGAGQSTYRDKVAGLLAGLESLPLDSEAADLAADVRRELERNGKSIGMADSLIAGIVLARGDELLTRNRSHFERVKGLRLAEIS